MANNFGMRSSLTLGGSGLLSSKTPSTDGWACPDGQLALPYVRRHPAVRGAAPHAPEIAPLTLSLVEHRSASVRRCVSVPYTLIESTWFARGLCAKHATQ